MEQEEVPEFGWADPDSPFDMGDYRDDRERRFVEAMRARALGWAALGVGPEEAFVLPDDDVPALRLGVDVVDREAGAIVRTFQVRFDHASVVVGVDPTAQFTDPPDPRRSSTLRATSPATAPEALASFACDWLEAELIRPIERHEWEAESFRHTRWVMGDTGEELMWSDSANDPRPELGEPDRRIVVHGAQPPTQPQATRPSSA
ncbi:MAG TPA: hypothetical protein VFJ16_13115 [Longimicrobium sp.]|nr:hypothetical protein [Longimicrobium sp.]